MIRRLAHIGAGLCLAAIPLALTMTAGADSASSFGWWYQLNDSALLIAPPPPPDAPSGGIYVQGGAGPGGNVTTAYGAVHFTSSTGEGVVKLAIQSTNGPAVVAMCPTTSAWLPADGGVWQRRPTYSCDAAKALGEVSADGKSLTFPITSALSSGAGQFDVVIVPDPTAQTVFSMALTAPSADFFTGTTPTTLPPLNEPPPIPSDYDPGDGNTLGGYIPDSGGGSTNSNSFLSRPNTTPAPVVTPAPTTGNAGGGVRGPLATQPISSNPSSAERVMAGIALGLMAAGLWFIGNRPLGGLTPALVKAGAVSAHGGVGRFARVRTSEPTRLA